MDWVTFWELEFTYLGAAIYIYEGFKSEKLSTLFGLLIALSGLLSTATLLHGFYGYLDTFFHFPKTLTIVTFIIILSSIAIWGISESLITTAIFTIIEIIGLFMVIIVGLPYVEFDFYTFSNYIYAIDTKHIHYILLAGFLALFAFIGFKI